jgi:Zn finger protein HypA/HybF involved in hydrogenase expression
MTTKRYSDDDLIRAVETSFSVMEVMRTLGIRMAGGSHSHISRRISKMGLDTTHFKRQAHNKGKPSVNKRAASEILVILPEGSNRPKGYRLSRALKESGVEYQCSMCLLISWMGKSITLEVDHIDGDWLNNKIDNLRFLCPNCHSQTSTFSRRSAHS